MKRSYGIDLTRNAGWFLLIVGWRQLLLLWIALSAMWWLGYWWGVSK